MFGKKWIKYLKISLKKFIIKISVLSYSKTIQNGPTTNIIKIWKNQLIKH